MSTRNPVPSMLRRSIQLQSRSNQIPFVSLPLALKTVNGPGSSICSRRAVFLQQKRCFITDWFKDNNTKFTKELGKGWFDHRYIFVTDWKFCKNANIRSLFFWRRLMLVFVRAVKNALIGDLELEPPKRMTWVEFKGDEDLVCK
jgi:hypothetical protein